MRRFLHVSAALAIVAGGAATFIGGQAFASQSTGHDPRVLLVCNGSTSPCPATRARQYATVQSAVNAAKPGDWILIYPGVYHENTPKWHSGVWVGTRNLHIRGLDRNGVIIDGSKGNAKFPCPSRPALQNYAPRNGIEVAASGVSVENLTVCDYLGLNGKAGNEIWWNGGDGSGKIGMTGYSGSYLTATAMFKPKFKKGANPESPNFAQYGIFVSNASGGRITNSYASNMADAAYYIGACQQVCDAVLAHDVGANSALGYSGTNAGGRLTIRDSVFVGNRTGLAPNSLNNDDAPPPQNGRCPHSTVSCLVIHNNLVIDNNNPNVPLFGLTPAIGAGIELSGTAYDTVRDNVIVNQGSWGVITHDYPDPNPKPPPASHCQGGFPNMKFLGMKVCDFPSRGNLVYGNRFVHVGFFGNPSNSDLATLGLVAKSPTPRNCFWGNVARNPSKLTSAPAHIERASVDGRPCGPRGTFGGTGTMLFDQLICSTYGICLASGKYPAQTTVEIAPLPKLRSMPKPCAGVPTNPFCAK